MLLLVLVLTSNVRLGLSETNIRPPVLLIVYVSYEPRWKHIPPHQRFPLPDLL